MSTSTPRKVATPQTALTPLRSATKRTPRKTTPMVTFAKSPIVSKVPREMYDPEPHVQADDRGGEGIIVAIRMRPLNTKESSERRIWKVLPQFKSVTQTTPAGKPLPERIMGRTFFTFDKTFGEETDTRQVYDGIAKGIVDSVVHGLNGTIFAYGQTSSGKTYTMQGSGSIEEGSVSGSGGIVHMAAQDIFSYISKTQDRVFLVRASFVEIYNEEVRDLLGANNNILQVREDPRRGIFVNSEEEIAVNCSSLLQVLFKGEKNRAVAATAMNERSSRSHTIFKITIESRRKSSNNENDSDALDDDGAVRVSTLNLVDLAGSESVRHTGNTGDRLKEGGKINQSLLTLSRVIVGLGDPMQTHINFRDSKLTRILQPSLSGNARMAVVCCATPSELYLEETRSTLGFASRAKLVKTNAKVNEVLDDQSLIRRLQRELAEAKRASSGDGFVKTDQLRALETEAANAGKERREAQEKLRRLQKSILNSTALFETKQVSSISDVGDPKQRKRRLSDGNLNLRSLYETPSKQQKPTTPKSVPGGKEPVRKFVQAQLSPSSELALVRHAVAAKGAQTKVLEQTIEAKSRTIEIAKSNLERTQTERDIMSETLRESEAEVCQLREHIDCLKGQLDTAVLEKEKSIGLLDDELRAKEEMERQLSSNTQHSNEIISRLEAENARLKDNLCSREAQMDAEIVKLRSEKDSFAASCKELGQKLRDTELGQKTVSEENVRIAFQFAQLVTEKEIIQKERDVDRHKMQTLSGEIALLMGTMKDAAQEKDELKVRIAELRDELDKALDMNDESKVALRSTEIDLQETRSLAAVLEQRITTIEQISQTQTTVIKERDEQIAALELKIGALSQIVAAKNSDLESAEHSMMNLEESLNEAMASCQKLEEAVRAVTTEKESAFQQVQDLQHSIDDYDQCLEDLTASANSLEEENRKLSIQVQNLQREQDTNTAATAALNDELAKNSSSRDVLTNELEVSRAHLIEAGTTIAELEKRITLLHDKNQVESLTFDRERAELLGKLEQTNDHLSEKQKAILENEAIISELRAAVSVAEAKCTELVNSTNRLTIERDAELEHRDKTILVLRKEVQHLKDSLASQEQIINEAENSNEDLEKELKQEQIKSLQREREIEELTLERERLSVDIEESRQILSAEIDELKLAVLASESASSGHDLVVQELRHSLSLTENQAIEQRIAMEQVIQDFDVSKLQLQTKINQLNEEVEELRSSSLVKDTTIGLTSSKCDSLLEQLAQLESEAFNHATILDTIRAENDSLRSEMQTAIDDLTSEIQELKSSVATKDDALDQQIALVDQIKTEHDSLRDKMQTDIDDLTHEIEELRSSIADKDEALGQQLANVDQIKTEYDNSRSEMQTAIDDLTSEIQELKSSVAAKDDALDQQIALVDQIKTEHDSLRNKMQTDIDDLTHEIEELRSTVAGKDEALGQQLANVDQIKTEYDNSRSEMQTAIDDLTSEIQELKSSVAAKDDALDQQLAFVDQIKTEHDSLRNKMQTDIDDLTHEIEELRSSIAVKDDEVKGERDNSRKEMQMAIDDLTSEIQVLNSNVAAKEKEHYQHLALVDNIKAEHDNLRKEMQMEVGDLTDRLHDLRSNVEAKDKAIVESMRKAEELQKQLARVESSSVERAAGFAGLRLQCDASNAELVKTTDVLTSEISQLRSTVASKDDEIHQLNQNIALLQEGREKLETKSQDLALKCNEALNQKTSLQSDINALLASRKEMQQELDIIKVSLSSISTERELLLKKIEAAHNAARTEQGTFAVATSELSEAVSSLEKEKYELTQLLAAANASVREAREAAFAADEELDLKERKLEEILSMLSQREEELFSRTQQVDDLKRQLEGSEPSEIDVLLDTIKALQEEKMQLEELVAKASKERDAQEQEHRKRMGEEQRLLIREAEGEMTNLRTVRDQLKSALAQSETALFAIQQENERLVEEKKRLESKSHDSLKNIPLLESEVSRLKSVNLDLTIENKDLASKVSILRKENGSQDLKANEEVVKLTTEVNRLKAETFAARQRTLELQEAVRVSERQSQTYLEESQSERQRRQDIESTVTILQAEIEKLRQSMLKKENAIDADITRKLQEVEDLRKDIINRDARIKKLEAVRLTKEQCAALKKIKEERSQFLEDNERYRRQLAECESEIASLRAQGIGSNRGKQAGEDITALRFEKDALETKLRKYLAYCKALEGDKSQIIDALRANKREVVDDDFVGAVVTLCDQLASLEEECDALSSAEERASSYLAEIERLREQISSFQTSAADAKNKILSLTRSESELSSQLKKVEQKCASLRDEREKFRSRTATSGEDMPEKNRQVKYLEQENLQLMLDLKAVKKQLQASRSELDALRMKDLDDNTVDFSHQMARVGKATSSSSNAVSSKSSDELDSTTEAEKENVIHDDFNRDSKVARGSAMKHRFSRAKATRMREPSGRAVGLGDSGLDDENTGECRQS